MNERPRYNIRWHILAVATGFASGFAAAVLALLISGNTYSLGIPEWTIWLPLPILPLLSLAALNKAVKPIGAIHRLTGWLTFIVAAFSGAYLLAVLIARADHG